MAIGASTARLTIELRPDASRAVAAQVVQRAHAAGLPSATVHRGSAARLQGGAIPPPRSVSLADEEGLTVVVTGDESRLEAFAATVNEVTMASSQAIEVDGNVRLLQVSPVGR
jgi:hypothetical protein